MANLADHLFRQDRERGDKCALIYKDRAYSFTELAYLVRQIAGGLSRAGVGVGSRVGLMLYTRPEFVLYQQAIFALGGILSPLNVFYKRAELAHAVAVCRTDYLIVGSEFVGLLPEPGGPDRGALKRIFVVDLPPDDAPNSLIVSAATLEGAAPITEPVALPPEALGMVLKTSATTGKAKGVMLSIGNIQANYDRTPGWLGLDQSTVTLCALPLYNTFGLNQCINATMVTGGTMVLIPRFDAGECLAAIEKSRCTFFPGVPTMLQSLLDHPDAAHRDISSIGRILTGAAPVPAPLLQRIKAKMGGATIVMTGYGLTEATAIVTLDQVELDAEGNVRRPRSIGRVLPGMEMKIVTPDGAPVAVGERGEICVRGPNVMQGYSGLDDETSFAIRDGWLHTGDIGVTDAEGFAYVVDRLKDVIIRGGQNIYPADIEETIYHYPGVKEVAVIGAPDERFGEVPIAFVALRAGETVSAEDIIQRCKAALACFNVPTAVHFLPELPKGPTGKILRRALRAP